MLQFEAFQGLEDYIRPNISLITPWNLGVGDNQATFEAGAKLIVDGASRISWMYPNGLVEGVTKIYSASDSENGLCPVWKKAINDGRQPFMLALCPEAQPDKLLRPLAVIEGREYTFSPRYSIPSERYPTTYDDPDRAIFINWIVRDNMPDGYSRNKQEHDSAFQLYMQLFELAKLRGVGLVIAGINPANLPSIRLHKRLGFSLERTENRISPYTHRTRVGAYVPSSKFENITKGQPGWIDFYTCRIDQCTQDF